MPITASGNIDRALSLIGEIEEVVNNSRNVFRGQRLLNGNEITGRLEELRRSLPSAITQAENIVRDEKQVRANAAAEAAKALADAMNKSESIQRDGRNRMTALEEQIRQAEQRIAKCKDEADDITRQAEARAQAQVQTMMNQSQAEADRIINEAQARAQMIIAQANQEAARLMEQEQIYMRAAVEAERLRTDTAQEMDSMRKQAFSYIDNQLASLEEITGTILTDIHSNREALNGMR